MKLLAVFLAAALTGPALRAGQAGDGKGTVKTERRTRIHLGTISVSAGYSRGYPYFPGYWSPLWPYYGFYDPFFYSPAFYPGFTAYAPDKGEIKLEVIARDAEVFIDGGYAGRARALKTLWLDPGAYNLEVRDRGQTLFSRRIYVLSGKTLRLEPGETEKRP